MAPRFQAPRGTADVLPADAGARARIEEAARDLLERAGYVRIETPLFEDTELFARGVGGSTDIVRKEMFTFEDKGGRSITLRPEATASIVRAYLQHGMQKLPQPVKLWWYGPLFRHERPQAGRFRQFTQLDVEVIGSDSPLVDAELILLCDEFLRALEVPDLTLRIGSLGSPDARAEYREELVAYLREHESELDRDVRDRMNESPLRAFDSKDTSTQAVMAEAPIMLDRLEGEDAEHFAAVCRLLDQAGLAYEIDGTMVRGLDYYTRTVFEFHGARLGPEVALAGGGRYDRLAELLGGPPTPANGWAAGIERILLSIPKRGEQRPHDVFVAAEDSQRARALALVIQLRRAGLRADLDLAGRGMKGQMRQADRSGAPQALIVDAGGGVQLRDMRSGEQREIDIGRVVEELSTA